MNNIKSPCEECITYAICNSTIKDHPTPDVSKLSIERSCELLKSFLGIYYDNRNVFKKRIDIARKVFNLEEIRH